MSTIDIILLISFFMGLCGGFTAVTLWICYEDLLDWLKNRNNR